MKDLVKYKVIDFCYVTDFVANGSFASLRENVSYINSPDYAVLVRLTDFTKKWSKDFVYVSKASYDFLKKSSLNKGDLIMSNVGEPGIVFLVPDLNQPMTLGPNSILIRPNKNTSTSKFLYFYFLSEIGKKQIDDISTGAAQKKFNKTSFRDIEITLPPLSEQQRIVAILDEAFAAIAKAKANAEQNLKNTKELFESYLQGMFKNNGDGWEIKKLGEVCEVITKGTTPTSLGFKFTDEGVNFIKVESLTESGQIIPNKVAYISEECHKYLKRSQLKENDILFSIAGALGRIGIVKKEIIPANTNQALAIVRLAKNSGISVSFLAMYFTSNVITEEIEKLKGGAAQQNLSLGQLNNLSIPFPTLPQHQQDIVQKLDALSIETKKLEAIYNQKINDLEELKKSVLQKAFSGELKTSKIIV